MDNYITRQEHAEHAKRMEDEHRRQNYRIGELEKATEQNHKLLISVEKLAVNMETMQKEQQKQGGRDFDIPYTRDELAQRLYANRSALSREIGRMIREGLIETKGKHFVIKW